VFSVRNRKYSASESCLLLYPLHKFTTLFCCKNILADIRNRLQQERRVRTGATHRRAGRTPTVGEYPLYSRERSASTMASSASDAVRKQAEAVGSPPPSIRTGRGPEASTKEKTRLSTGRMLSSPAAASGVSAGSREMHHRAAPESPFASISSARSA
jgi:hypothetical protein